MTSQRNFIWLENAPLEEIEQKGTGNSIVENTTCLKLLGHTVGLPDESFFDKNFGVSQYSAHVSCH